MAQYILSKVSVNCLIKKGNKILLVQQARPEHVKGKWSVPGGKVDEGENFQEAVSREIREEVGLYSISAKPIDIIHESPEKTVKHIFVVRAKEGKVKFNKDEILDVRWFTLAEIKKMKRKFLLRGEWIYNITKLILK